MIGDKQILFLNLETVLARPISGKKIPEDWTDFRINVKLLDKLMEDYKGKYIFIYSFMDDTDEHSIKIDSVSNICCDYIYKIYDRDIIFDYTYLNYYGNTLLSDFFTMYNNLWSFPESSMFIIGNSFVDRKLAEQYNIEYVNLNTFLNGV